MNIRQKLDRIEITAASVRFDPASPSEQKLSDAICGLIQVVRDIYEELHTESDKG